MEVIVYSTDNTGHAGLCKRQSDTDNTRTLTKLTQTVLLHHQHGVLQLLLPARPVTHQLRHLQLPAVDGGGLRLQRYHQLVRLLRRGDVGLVKCGTQFFKFSIILKIFRWEMTL